MTIRPPTPNLSAGHYNTLFYAIAENRRLQDDPAYQGKPLGALAFHISTNPQLVVERGASSEHLTLTPSPRRGSPYINNGWLIPGKPFHDFQVQYHREDFRGSSDYPTSARALERPTSVLGLNAAFLAYRAYEDLVVNPVQESELVYSTSILKKPNTPLNGNEGEKWLRSYAEKMREKKLELFEEWAVHQENPLVRLETEKDPRDIRHVLTAYVMAQNNARGHLEKLPK